MSLYPRTHTSHWREREGGEFLLYRHIADPLYNLLRNRKKLEWTVEYTEAVKKMKGAIHEVELLKKLNSDQSMIVTVDRSPKRSDRSSSMRMRKGIEPDPVRG